MSPLSTEPEGYTAPLLKALLWVSGTLWSLLLILVGVLWKRQGEDIEKLEGALASKASTEETARLEAAVAKKANANEVERRRETQDLLFRQQREDKDDILKAIHELSGAVAKNHEYVLQQLGDRPTRKEMMEFFQAGLAAANPRVPDPRRLAP